LPSGKNRHKAVNVLFTSAGRRVELFRAFRKAFTDLGLGGRIIATDIDHLAPALQEADSAHILPRTDDPEFIPTLQEILQNEDVNLVFPLIDPDIPVLAAHRGELESENRKVAVIDVQAALTTRDKWLTYQFLKEHGIPTPSSWLLDEQDLPSQDGPFFLKPRKGSAGKNAFKITSTSSIRSLLPHVPQPLLQEWLPGPEITNDVLCGLNGELWAIVSRERIEVRWGEVAKGRTVENATIRQYCERIAQVLPARGPITVQCILREGEPYFTEINARFGGGLPLGIAAGVPSPHWYLSEAAGLDFTPPPLGSYHKNLYLTRFDDTFFLREADDGTLQRYRI
jgi:carbamoyl-phosphate synthase large subunit